MKRILTTIFYVLTLLVLSKCTYTCPSFNMKSGIVSQRLNDTLTYVSDLSDTLLLVVEQFNANQEGKTHTLLIGFAHIDCEEWASYSTSLSNPFQIQIKEDYNSSSHHTITFCSDKEYDLYFREENVDYTIEHYQEKEVDGHIYQFVDIGMDLSSNRRIDSFIKAYNYGVIQFHDKQTGLVWRMVNK